MRRPNGDKSLPPWLLGLLLAVVIFAATLFLLDYLGYGDDPVIDSSAVALLL